MTTRLRLMTAFAIAAAWRHPRWPRMRDHNMEILRQKIKADKKLVVAQNLNLTDAEGRRSGPCTRRTRKISSRSTSDGRGDCGVCRRLQQGPVTNETAKKLLDESLAIDEAEAQLKKATAAKAMAALPAMKAARYIQIENKIRAAIRYELAANIPLVQ